MKKTFFVIALLLFTVSIFAKTKIFGNSKDYANNELIFYKYADRITYDKEKIFTLVIDENGDFDAEINLTEITYVFGEFGIYHAYFYAEPDKSYELLLPPFAEKEEEDILNPFFEPEEIHIGIKNLERTDLNYLIIDFDYFYERYLGNYLIEIYYLGLESNIDTFIVNINNHYKDVEHPYFNSYKDYRIANLKNIATQKKYEPVLTLSYYTKDSILYDNPAYMDLFNSIYNSYFDRYLLSTKKGHLLYRAINYGHSISRLHKLLSEEIELRSTQFRELVILKGISDAFAGKNLSWDPLLKTLDSLSVTTEYKLHKDIAQRIADNALILSPKTVAPIFELSDSDNNIVNLKNFRGKYVYLQFANTSTYNSKAEFDLLKKIYNKYKSDCIFITILTDSDIEKAEKFIKRNDLEWIFLFVPANSSVLGMYNVLAYPTYYLIDPSGMLKISPAPGPSENFEDSLFKIIESEKGNN